MRTGGADEVDMARRDRTCATALDRTLATALEAALWCKKKHSFENKCVATNNTNNKEVSTESIAHEIVWHKWSKYDGQADQMQRANQMPREVGATTVWTAKVHRPRQIKRHERVKEPTVEGC